MEAKRNQIKMIGEELVLSDIHYGQACQDNNNAAIRMYLHVGRKLMLKAKEIFNL